MSGVLIIEDRKKTLQNLKEFFERKGELVFSAQDAMSASIEFQTKISVIYAIIIDLRLMDSTTDDLGGYELALRFRSFNKDVPIFIYSASEIEDRIRNDRRIDHCFYKGRERNQAIYKNFDLIKSKAEEYWGDFHRDDANDLILMKDRFGIDDESFLSLIAPKTPARHRRLLKETISAQNVDEILSLTRSSNKNWSGGTIQEIQFSLPDENSSLGPQTVEAIVQEGAEGNVRATVASLPFLYAYGGDKEEALGNISDLLEVYGRGLFNVDKAGTTALQDLSGVDFLRLKRFFKALS